MPSHAVTVIQSQLDRLRAAAAASAAGRQEAMAAIARHEENLQRIAAQVEALEETLDAVTQESPGKAIATAERPAASNGHVKQKPTEAIMGMLDAKGAATREELLTLADKIDTQTDKPRHLLQTTLYLLRKRGKIVIGKDKLFRRTATPEGEP